MRVFYSHHVWKYGSPIEEYEMGIINETLEQAEIINPVVALNQELPESEIMEDTFNEILMCDALVFSSFSGMIGHGTFNEIIFALNNDKEVYYLVGDEIYPIEEEDATAFIQSWIKKVIFNGENRRYALVYDPYDYSNS